MINQQLPKVSVYVLAYNDSGTVRRAVDSVLSQTYKNLDVFLLDNGSTDNTLEIFENYLTDPRVTIIKNPINQRSEFGAAKAMNCQSEFITFLFADDYYSPKRIELSLQEMEENIAAIFSNCEFRDESNNIITTIPPSHFRGDISSMSKFQHLHHFLDGGNSLHPCSMFIRTKTYKELTGFHPYLHRIGDMEFFTRLLLIYDVKFLKEKLQTITIWNSGRNESHMNNIDHTPILIERNILLQSFNTKEAITNVHNIFPEIINKTSAEATIYEKKFWMGYSIFQLKSLDYSIFGFQLMMESYNQSPQLINTICLNHWQESFSSFCYSQTQPNQYGRTNLFFFKFKSFLKKVPFLQKIKQTLRFLLN